MQARRYRLRSADADIALTDGRFFVGRGRECQLVLDDPLVSRRHAVLFVDGGRVTVEDLGSRNGTLVNGARIEAAVMLEEGDRLTIGVHQLTLVAGARGRERKQTVGHGFPSGAYERPAPTVRPPAPVADEATRSISIFGMLIGACERALVQGDVRDAETSAGNLVVSLRAEILRGRSPDDRTMGALVSICLGLAAVTGSARWLERLFEVFGAARRVMDAETIDHVHEEVLRQGFVVDAALEAYLARLRLGTPCFTDDQQRLVARLEELATG